MKKTFRSGVLSLFSLFSCFTSLLTGGFLFPSAEQDLSQVLAGNSRCHYTAVSSCPALKTASNTASFWLPRYRKQALYVQVDNINGRDQIRLSVCLCVLVCVRSCVWNAPLIERTRATISLSCCRFPLMLSFVLCSLICTPYTALVALVLCFCLMPGCGFSKWVYLLSKTAQSNAPGKV